MEIILKRRHKKSTYTIGDLYINGVWECNTIEDTDRNLDNSMTKEYISSKKIYGKTAIPCGTYKVDMSTISPAI